MIGVPLSSRNALNLYTVRVFGQRWLVFSDSYTKFESAYGELVKPEEVLVNHVLEIKGVAVETETSQIEGGRVEATVIRDLSIKTGTPPSSAGLPSAPQTASVASPVIASSPAFLPAPVVLAPKPPLAATVASYPQKLTSHLKLGMRGGEIEVLQEFLQKAGWGIPNDGPVTGFFGAVTKKAVIKFQESQGLETTGETGPLTREFINSLFASGLAPSVVAKNSAASTVTSASVNVASGVSTGKQTLTQYLFRGMRGGEVLVLQEFLQKHNWGIPNDGPVSGYFGKVTEDAVKKFQEANLLEAVGSVGPKTRGFINLLLGRE